MNMVDSSARLRLNFIFLHSSLFISKHGYSDYPCRDRISRRLLDNDRPERKEL